MKTKMLRLIDVNEGVNFFNWLSDEGLFIGDFYNDNDIFNSLLIHYRMFVSKKVDNVIYNDSK